MQIYRELIKYLIVIVLYFLGCRVTSSAVSIVPVIFGMVAVIRNRIWFAYSMMALLLFTVIINPLIVPKESILFVLSVRVGVLLMAISITGLSLSKNSGRKLPMALMLCYMGVAVISSAGGWAPIISYIKFVNFSVFFLALWTGMGTLGKIQDLVKLRGFFGALIAFAILASVALIPFPGVSCLNAMHVMRATGDYFAADEMFANKSFFDNSLYCGITYQSQTLGPLMAVSVVYLLVDMAFFCKKVSFAHLGLMLLALPVLYKTRSRVALVSLVSGVGCAGFLILRSFKLPVKVRMAMRKMMIGGCLALTILMIVLEVKEDAISRYVRKNDAADVDNRSLGEAFVSSRMGAVEMNLHDFMENPLFGTGFQVWEKHRLIKRGSLADYFSAPIEKGVLPVMVLGETGLIGALVFAGFVLCFYAKCLQFGYAASMSIMTAFLFANLGEAIFFSPGAVGGLEWLFFAVGGFAIDKITIFTAGNERWRLGYGR